MARLSSIGRKDFWVFCVLCTHFSRWRVIDLQNRLGYDADLGQIVGKFRCGNCRTYSATVKFKQPMNDLKLLRKYQVPK